MGNIKNCPIEIVFEHLGKKWAINIIRDLFFERRTFTDFLQANPKLSTRILSLRLKELEEIGFIKKIIVSKTPLKAEYYLTKKGQNLNKVLYELSIYTYKNLKNDFLKNPKEFDFKKFDTMFKKNLKIKT